MQVELGRERPRRPPFPQPPHRVLGSDKYDAIGIQEVFTVESMELIEAVDTSGRSESLNAPSLTTLQAAAAEGGLVHKRRRFS